jgi:hypothetical protein
VYGKYIGASLAEVGDVAARVHNHQVHIERLLRMLLDMLDNGLAKRDVGHKQAVHHVDVQPVSLRGVQHFYVALQVAEVGTEQRRGYHLHGNWELGINFKP